MDGGRHRVAPMGGSVARPEGTPGLEDWAPGISGTVGTANVQWMVLWTKARQEKAIGRYLASRNLEFFLPLVERVSYWRGRKHVSSVPMFPGYVFLAGEIEDGYAAVATKRVCQLIRVADQARLVRELEQVETALQGGAELDLHRFAVIGRRCRIVKGPLEGIEGVVTERLGPGRLVLQVNVIAQAASLEIDADLLEPID